MGRRLENYIIHPDPCGSSDELLARLRPNHRMERLQFGYLGVDEDLDYRIAEDRQRMVDLGLGYEDLARAIELLFENDDETVNGNPIVRRRYIHSPVCPWGDYTTVSIFVLAQLVTEVYVINRETCPPQVSDLLIWDCGLDPDYYPKVVEEDWVMIFSDLHPHLIREHQFLEGLETPYRVEPARAKRYLGL